MANIKNLKKGDILNCVKLVIDAGASSSPKEAEKVMNYSLAPGIKPLNPNYYVLFSGKNIIGVSGLYYDYEDPKDVMWVDYFAIKPEFQRQGHGTEMLEYLENICKSKKVRMLCVFTDTALPGALDFYKKNGFEVTGKIDNYFGKSAKVWLRKLLR